MIHKKEVVRDWLERIQNEGRRLNEWEEDFIMSVSEQFDLRGTLTEAQEEKIERIYNERVK